MYYEKLYEQMHNYFATSLSPVYTFFLSMEGALSGSPTPGDDQGGLRDRYDLEVNDDRADGLIVCK